MQSKKYIKKLEEAYKALTEVGGVETKLEYIGNCIFDFHTYDSELDKLFASKMIEVLDAIINKRNFEYHTASRANYINYLIAVNMPFLKDKIEYGTSIRGAWIKDDGPYSFDCDRVIVDKGELVLFICDLVEWSKS